MSSSSSEGHGSDWESNEEDEPIDDWEPSSDGASSSDDEHTSSSSSLASSLDTCPSSSIPPKPNKFINPFEFNFDLEEDGIVDIEIWRSYEAYDACPNQMIHCPLSKEALDQYYGVDIDAYPTFKQQMASLELKYNEKPINHYKPSCSSKKAKKEVMEPLDVSMWWLVYASCHVVYDGIGMHMSQKHA